MAKRRVPHLNRLTPGAASAQRGSVACRPWHPDWARQNVVEICDFIAGNPWVQEKLGKDVDVSVRLSDDGDQVAFIFSRGGTWPEGGMGGVPPMPSDSSRS